MPNYIYGEVMLWRATCGMSDIWEQWKEFLEKSIKLPQPDVQCKK